MFTQTKLLKLRSRTQICFTAVLIKGIFQWYPCVFNACLCWQVYICRVRVWRERTRFPVSVLSHPARCSPIVRLTRITLASVCRPGTVSAPASSTSASAKKVSESLNAVCHRRHRDVPLTCVSPLRCAHHHVLPSLLPGRWPIRPGCVRDESQQGRARDAHRRQPGKSV